MDPNVFILLIVVLAILVVTWFAYMGICSKQEDYQFKIVELEKKINEYELKSKQTNNDLILDKNKLKTYFEDDMLYCELDTEEFVKVAKEILPEKTLAEYSIEELNQLDQLNIVNRTSTSNLNEISNKNFKGKLRLVEIFFGIGVIIFIFAIIACIIVGIKTIISYLGTVI